jgi:hypothetical protein
VHGREALQRAVGGEGVLVEFRWQGAQIEALYQRGILRRGVHAFTSIACRSPSLSRLKQIEVTKMHAPGSTATQGWT